MKAGESKTQVSNQAKDETYWNKIFGDYEESNLIRSVYCRQNQINYDNFGYWWRKLKNKSVEALIPIKIKSEYAPQPERNRALSTLTFKNGNSLVIYEREALLLILSKMI
jgi:hypothetical protein